MKFEWHPGLLIEDSTLQVPFLADLVTLADPTSPFSFLNYLKKNNRIYPFFIRENMFILRTEYSLYCQWVVSQLNNVHFGQYVERIEYDKESRLYHAFVKNVRNGEVLEYWAKNIVLGTGTSPFVPDLVEEKAKNHVIHSSLYLNNKKAFQKSSSITVVGSGQSAAEIFFDLLREEDAYSYELNWVTRTPRFFPLEYGKLTLELTSPEYIHYFYHLPPSKRDELILQQSGLYKGINLSLINQIYDLLYAKSVQGDLKVRLIPNVELTSISQGRNGDIKLSLLQKEVSEKFHMVTDKVILGTGYTYKMPACIDPILPYLNFDDQGRLKVALNYGISNENNIFVQNVGLYTHGLVTPDLGMGCYRNALILKAILGKECYPIESKIAFQDFAPFLNTNQC